MDWSEKVLCLKCNKGGNLLVCSEEGCPLAVHEGCMGCPPRFDDEGRYYCPYCFHKKAVAESRRAREYALATKKALLVFMNEKTTGSEKHIEEDKGAENNGHNELNENIIACNNGSKENCDASLDQAMQPVREHEIGNAEEEMVQKEESGCSSGSKGQDPSPKLHDEQSIGNEVDIKSQEENESIRNEEEITNQEEEHETCAASSGQNPSCNKHEKVQEDQCGMSSPSTGEGKLTVHARITRQSKRKKPVELNSEAISVRTAPTLKKKTIPTRSSPRISSALETRKGLNHVVGSPKRLKQPIKSPATPASDVFGSGKRKKLIWTEKEEEELRAGVEKFSNEVNMNIPWRKILDMGRGVFNESRTPTDLKDKWRKMSVK